MLTFCHPFIIKSNSVKRDSEVTLCHSGINDNYRTQSTANKGTLLKYIQIVQLEAGLFNPVYT